MNFAISVQGDEKAAMRLTRIGSKASRARPLLNELTDKLLEIQEERFDRKQGMKGVKPSTKRTDRRQGRDPRPLRDTGDLMRSVTQRGDSNQLLRVRDNYLVLGTTLYYARFHHTGTGGMPKRKVLNVTPKKRKEIGKYVLEYLVEE